MYVGLIFQPSPPTNCEELRGDNLAVPACYLDVLCDWFFSAFAHESVALCLCGKLWLWEHSSLLEAKSGHGGHVLAPAILKEFHLLFSRIPFQVIPDIVGEPLPTKRGNKLWGIDGLLNCLCGCLTGGLALLKMCVTACYTGCVFVSYQSKRLTMTNWPNSSGGGHLNVT